MKKIYTVTFQRVLNYGAILQTYALHKFLKDSGFDAKVLDYAPLYFMMQTCRPAKGIKKTIDKYKKYKKFNDFRKQHLLLTPKTYFTQASLSKLPSVHAAICGSDQIWNKNLTGNRFDPVFFLDFTSSNTKRIAFAASAGSIRIAEFSAPVKGMLEKFYSIGVRETTLSNDVSIIVPEASPEVVVDPCLLLDDYSAVMDKMRLPKGKFIVSYVVGSGEMLDKFDQRIKELKQFCDLPVVHIGAKSIVSADENILDLGPSDWITFIKEASFVVTNSFHGTAFSINFNKDFLFIPHIVANLNARQTTLLENVGLMNRMLPPEKELSENLVEPIDYEEVNVKLDSIKAMSKSFLIKALR